MHHCVSCRNLDVTKSNEEPGRSYKGPAEGAIGSNVITAAVVGVMVTAQKKRQQTLHHEIHFILISLAIYQNKYPIDLIIFPILGDWGTKPFHLSGF